MDDKRPLLLELGHILYRRNLIERRRTRALSKIFYYKNLKEVVDAYRGFNPRLRRLERELSYIGAKNTPEDQERFGQLTHRVHQEKTAIEYIKNNRPKPTKWINNISELRKLILKYHAEYAKAKYDAARLTSSTRNRISFLTKALNVTINYTNGYVCSVTVKGEYWVTGIGWWTSDLFEQMFKEVEASRAVENMLKGKYGKQKQQEEKIKEES